MEHVQAYAPGRTELAGNHTDHQGGCVIAAAVSCGVRIDVLAISDFTAQVESEGFAPVSIDLESVEPRLEERFTTASLVRGVVAGLRSAGVELDGFQAKVESTVPAGGGLSSSAAFELALACALAELAGKADTLSPVQLARIGQAAERDWFGKACGLMDQLAVALGGIQAIDFSAAEPQVECIDFDFASSGYALCLVDTHCDHSRYTDEYSQVAYDMNAVAAFLGAPTLSQLSETEFLERLGQVRAELGDVPALRGLHYYHEMQLVKARADALRSGDFDAFLQFTRQSGASSAQYLQNVSTFDRKNQPAMVALALVDRLLGGHGACRIHGGGFGGTIQAFVPSEAVADFSAAVDSHLGPGSCRAFNLGGAGAHVLDAREHTTMRI